MPRLRDASLRNSQADPAMGCLGAILIGLGGLFLLYGLVAFWVPPIAVLFLVPGLALIILGRMLRRKAREIRVRRDLGDRW